MDSLAGGNGLTWEYWNGAAWTAWWSSTYKMPFEAPEHLAERSFNAGFNAGQESLWKWLMHGRDSEGMLCPQFNHADVSDICICGLRAALEGESCC